MVDYHVTPSELAGFHFGAFYFVLLLENQHLVKKGYAAKRMCMQYNAAHVLPMFYRV